MEKKELIEFEMDGQPVYVEVEPSGAGPRRVSRGGGGEKAEKRFKDAIARIRPAADALLTSFKEMNTPDEIGLDFGIKFNARAGAVFASVDSEATFKVSLKWKNVKEAEKKRIESRVKGRERNKFPGEREGFRSIVKVHERAHAHCIRPLPWRGRGTKGRPTAINREQATGVSP